MNRLSKESVFSSINIISAYLDRLWRTKHLSKEEKERLSEIFSNLQYIKRFL